MIYAPLMIGYDKEPWPIRLGALGGYEPTQKADELRYTATAPTKIYYTSPVVNLL